jgi:hypothetical protein
VACGCFFVIAGILAGLAYCVSQGLWIPAIAIFAAAVLLGWLTKKMFQR